MPSGTTKAKKKRKSKINDINAAAKAAGMTYGQYVSKLYLEEQKRKEKENENL